MNQNKFNSAEFNGISLIKLIKSFQQAIATTKNFTINIGKSFIVDITEVSVKLSSIIKPAIVFITSSRKVFVSKVLSLNEGISFSFVKLISTVKSLVVAISYNVSHLFVQFKQISYNVYITLTKQLLPVKVINSFINISTNIAKDFAFIYNYTVNIMFSKLFNKAIAVVLSITDTIFKQAIKQFDYFISTTLHINRFADIVKHFTLSITFYLTQTYKYMVNVVLNIGIAITLPVAFFRLAWRKQYNPDIEGYHIYEGDVYGNWTLIKDTTKLVYLFGLPFNKRKFYKVIPYTANGEISNGEKPIIIKGVKS